MSSQHLVLTMDAYFLMHDIIAIMRLFFLALLLVCLMYLIKYKKLTISATLIHNNDQLKNAFRSWFPFKFVLLFCHDICNKR